jgi:hypothetical protein
MTYKKNSKLAKQLSEQRNVMENNETDKAIKKGRPA